MKRTYTGSCHCGAVRYEADIDFTRGMSECNCTFCTKTRAWKAFVKPPSFRVLSGSDNIKGYHKHPLASLKYFCDVCGVRTHEVGGAEYMGGDFVGILVPTLDDAEAEELITAAVRYADGRRDNWQNPPAETRHL